MGDVVKVLGSVTAIGGAILGADAASDRRKAARAQSRIQARARQREQLAQVRQNQIAAAQGAQGAASGGTLDSSGFRGSQGSIQSTTAGNVAFSNQVQGLQDYTANRLQSAAKTDTLIQLGSVVKDFAIQAATGGAGGTTPGTK